MSSVTKQKLKRKAPEKQKRNNKKKRKPPALHKHKRKPILDDYKNDSRLTSNLM
jgi:hypothetical protein